MMDTAVPSAEAARLAALERYAILDTPPEAGFDDIARLAAILTGCGMAYIALLDAGRQWLKSAHGFDAALLTCPRDAAFCNDTIQSAGLLVVPDLAEHPRYARYATVIGPPFLRFYAGAPLVTADGFALGTLCVVDTAPRLLTEAQRQGLALLAARVVTELELRRRMLELDTTQSRLALSEAELREMHDQLELDYQGAMDSMADGLLTIGTDGAVAAINEAAAAMLGLDHAAAHGATLQSLLPEDGSGDDLLDALLAPIGDGGPPVRRKVGFGARRLSVLSSAYRMRVGARRGRLALTASLTDITETERLAEAEAILVRDLAEQHRKLQTAYLQMEDSATRIRETARRVRVARIAGGIGVAGLFLAAGLYAWVPSPADWGGPAETSTGGTAITMAPEHVSARIAVVGMLDAGSVVSVIGPFDGLVQDRLFRYGGQVERGQPLLRLNLNEVEVRLRDARSAQIRARQRVAELRGWATGFEVARARRSVAGAELEASDIAARAAQTRMLLSRGIIAADEHRALVQQQRNQALQLQAAQNDLEATLARGDPQTLRIAELELANAEAKVQELEADVANATVLAPVEGVVLMPPEPQGGRRAETIEPGSRVQRGQTMFTIGALESFQVRATVDEIDVNKVRVGQAVTVTGDAFGDLVLEGRVTSVAAQAGGESSGRSGMPTFPVTVAVDGLTVAQRRQLAVGMSASLSIVTYDQPEALVLPPYAIRDQDGQRVVRVRADGQDRMVPVTLGISTPGGVEVRSGLHAGDVVLP
ncbi:multidrug resistance efflux pump [Humitalea rosea]|uniref:Multidrug resistance efflux pump n=1 Tax=Humitalea rosea TaxID=990373 RepID=A0A2W7IJE9_9PROT|nr:HlyD family efflux transporter periplasmic adaptor subunit [Humitalea rosea]PZW45832.1 multidrug resistance efflux pump [Humitalea rosea]